MPEKRALGGVGRRLAVEQQRRDVLEIQGLRRRHLGQRADRGDEVAQHDGFGNHAGGETSGVADDQRRAQAAFVEVTFARAGGRVVGRGAFFQLGDVHAAVIRGEDHHRVLGEAMLVEGLEHAAAGGVERFDERGVGRVEGLRVGRDALGRRGERDVRVVEGEVEQEGLGLVLRDELRGEVRLTEFALAALGRFRAGVRAAGEVLVEAMVGRLMALAAEVPLADGGRHVALGLEQFGDRRDAGRQVQVDRRAEQAVRGAVGASGEEGGDLQPGRALARHQGGARRRAHRGRGVSLREAGAVGGEPIEVRRALVLPAEATEVVDPEVVGEEDHDVRRGLLGAERQEAGKRGEEQAEEGAGHALVLASGRFVQRVKPTSVPSWTLVYSLSGWPAWTSPWPRCPG